MTTLLPYAAGVESCRYLGYVVTVDRDGFTVVASNGDTRRATTMAGVRTWIRKHRKRTGGVA